MPKAVKAKPEGELIDIKGRLRKLKVKHFRAIGAPGIEVELDDIVVLVGPNNAGKSSILRAYEVVMLDGSKEGHLKLDDFPNGEINPEALPEIELETVVEEGEPGAQWIDTTSGQKVVRERWVWHGQGVGKRSGFNVETGQWDEKVPWGAPNVANARRPLPHAVHAFDTPEEQADQINTLLRTAIINEAKRITDEHGTILYEKLYDDLAKFQEKAVDGAKAKVGDIEKRLNEVVASIFLDHEVEYNQPTSTQEKSISLFPFGGRLLLGPKGGHMSGLEYQGSGTRRTLMWAALRILSEENAKTDRPHVLLIDEPELCLHPNAIRDACKVLYDLGERVGWQVMVTTHSPVFIDLSRKNTSIIRVERVAKGLISGTTLFRPDRAKLEENDQKLLKLLNAYDPYVAEFFFGGKIIIVEGDTEYSAFKYVMALNPTDYGDVHIIRARGKATIVPLAKILNHFGTSYSILHDADKTQVMRKGKDGPPKPMANPAWGNNKNILAVAMAAPQNAKVRLVASIYNFEIAYFGELAGDEKPYNAIEHLKDDEAKLQVIRALLSALIDHSKPLPPGATDWSDLDKLKASVEAFIAAA